MVDAVGYIVNLFLTWLGIFAAPAQDLNMLWLLIPVYISWIFTDFYQERKGTSLGNAITNGIVPLWAGVDWGRTTVQLISSGKIPLDMSAAVKFVIIASMLAYGLVIIIGGLRRMKILKYIARIREVTYFVIMATPIIYGVVPVTTEVVISIFLFFPLFYGIFELLDRLVPVPEGYEGEEGAGGEMPSVEAELPGTGEPELPSLEQPALPTTPQQQYPQQQYQQYPQQYPQQYQRYPRQPGT
jgi:hypothetical protein